VIIRSTYFNASTAFGTATGTVEKKPPAKPASGGVFIGGYIHHTISKKSQFVTLITSDIFMHLLMLMIKNSMTSKKYEK